MKYTIGIIIPTFCDQRYLRDRDLEIEADSEDEAIEKYKTEFAFKSFLNVDEIRAVKQGKIKIGIIDNKVGD
jgi:D-hexose-6-phosphate mutarotase